MAKGDGGSSEPDVTADPFADVITAIDQMVTDLKAEEQDDLQTKQDCEKERMDNTQSAKMSSKKIDTNTETIDRLTAAIAAAKKEIEDIESQISDLNDEKTAADEQRSKEAKEFAANKADDEAAVGLIETAVGVLKEFYTKNNLALAQYRQEPFVAAGEAPTPPPSTWDESYGGAKGANNGIVAIMELIKGDIEKDVSKATDNENTAISEHSKLSADIADTISSLESTKSDLNGQIASDETSMATEKGERTTNQGDLKATLDFLKSIAPGCDFMAVNFQTRLTNRQAEMDGLLKAKAILNGASFD
jgi:predicted  nucleic acid-binding Zn-ribbon protein